MEISIVILLFFTGLFLLILHRVIASAVREAINSSNLFMQSEQEESDP